MCHCDVGWDSFATLGTGVAVSSKKLGSQSKDWISDFLLTLLF